MPARLQDSFAPGRGAGSNLLQAQRFHYQVIAGALAAFFQQQPPRCSARDETHAISHYCGFVF